jgi:hypothetical protein
MQLREHTPDGRVRLGLRILVATVFELSLRTDTPNELMRLIGGAVARRGLLDEAGLTLLVRGIEANRVRPSARAEAASAPADRSRLSEDFCRRQKSESYQRFIFESLLGEVRARRYQHHLHNKEAGIRVYTLASGLAQLEH